MATQAIDATIFASAHPDIAKRTSVSGLIFSVAMLLLGVLVFASTFEVTDRSSTLSMLLMVLGTAFFLLGIFRLFWKSKEVVYVPTGSITKERSVFFDLKHMGKLKEMIEKGQLSTEEGVKVKEAVMYVWMLYFLKIINLQPFSCFSLCLIHILR